MSTRTSAADINYLSVANGIWGLNEGSYYAQTLDAQPSPLNLMPADPQSYSAILKVCDGAHDLTLPASGQGYIDIAQGMENAVDLNNACENITISAYFGWGKGTGDQVITLKGGCKNVKLQGVIYSTGREADIVIDAWSDQSSALVTGTDLSCLTRFDTQPIEIILGRFGSKIDHYPYAYKVLFWKSLGYRIYWLAKWAALKLGLFGGGK